MTEIIDRLIDEAIKFCREWYASHPRDQMAPMFIGMTAQGQRIVNVARWANEVEKTAVLAAVRKEFRERQVTAYCTISETWISATVNKRAQAQRVPPESLTHYPGGDRPSEQADREERLMIMATDGTATVGRMFIMLRDHKGRVTDLTPDPINALQDSPTAQWGGRMIRLLD